MKELFGSFDLASNKECLLYRHYDYAIGVRHCVTSYCNGVENAPSAVNLAFLKSLICVDGKPYKTSTVENADLLSVPNIAKNPRPALRGTVRRRGSRPLRNTRLRQQVHRPLRLLAQGSGYNARIWLGHQHYRRPGYALRRSAPQLDRG